MSIVSHQTDNLELAVASILDGIEEVMDSGELVLDLNDNNVKKVTFLGETLEEVKAGVVGGGTLFGDDALRFLVSAIAGSDDAVVCHSLLLGGFVGSVDLDGLAAAVASLSLSLLGPDGLASQFNSKRDQVNL